LNVINILLLWSKVVSNCSALLENLSVSDSSLPALTFYQGRTLRGRLTYGELALAVSTLSGYLENVVKLRPGDRVLVLSPNGLEVPVLLLALWRVGTVVVPLNPNTGAEDWHFIAEHSGARGLFASKDFVGRFASPKNPLDFILSFEDFSKFSAEPVVSSKTASSSLAIVLYTSGTTGNPKGVGLSQSNLLSNGLTMARNFDFDRTTQFAVLPLYHAHALGFGLMSALSTRGHLVFTDKLDPFAWAEVIEKESVSYTSVVPQLLPLLMAARVRQKKVPSLKAILVSSAPLSGQIAQEFETKTEISLIQGWGLSEYTNFACCIPLTLSREDRRSLLFHAEGTSVGSPLPGTEVKVIALGENAGFENLGEGQRGELCVRGPSLMLGYYKDPETTRSSMITDGWLRTGDEGFYRQFQGQSVFFIAGRIKEIIIRGGDKHSPLAIEKKIFEKMPDLQGKLVVLGFAHELYGEEIGAYLEADELSESMRSELTQTLDAIALDSRPKVLLFSAAPIPRTHTGKIQRRKLQHLFSKFKKIRGPLKILSSQEPSGT
jgi:acyl-CoA synthetase (AMP-forming)/AMP-acid ligase II